MPKRRIRIEQADLARRATAAIEQADAAKEAFDNAALSFLLTELDAAITFCKVCKVALAPLADPTRIEHALDHVEAAIESALRTKEHVRLKASERKRFRGKVQQLEALVTGLALSLRGPRIKAIEEGLTRFR